MLNGLHFRLGLKSRKGFETFPIARVILESYWVICKLRELGLTNRTVDNLDSKPSKFECQIQSNSKSDVEIGFQLKGNDKIQLISINFCLKMFKFVQFVILFQFFSIKILIKRLKMVEINQK